jgi:hypothetical protein
MKFLITWDVPAKPEAPRRTFYNRLARILAKRNVDRGKLKGSVIILEDEEVAEEIYALAKAYGKAWLYQVEERR